VVFERLRTGKADMEDYKQYLSILSKALYLKTNIKPLVFIDEYDVPLNDAHENKYFKSFVKIISGMFSAGLKDNAYVGGAVITGCLQIAKNQIFTGFNNPSVFPVTSPVYANCFGFTKEESADLLHYYDLDSRMEDVRANYDGYNIGKYSVYNPFSLLKFVQEARADRNVTCKNYWVSTSGDTLLRKMLASSAGEQELRGTFETLLTGSSADKLVVDETIVYGTMTKSAPAVMGTLLFSGYLTVAKDYGNGTYALRIPNKEVLTCFRNLVGEYNDELREKKTPYLIARLLRGDIRKAEDYVNDLIRSVLVVRDKDTSENSFHYFLAAILAMANVPGWKILSQDQGRKGFSDFAIVGKRKQAIIIEEKVAKKKKEEIEGLFAEGEDQIKKNAYAEKYAYLGYDLYQYVIVYFEMEAFIRKV